MEIPKENLSVKKNWFKFLTIAFFLVHFLADLNSALGCKLFGATGSVTDDSITILSKDRDLFGAKRKQRIWYSPRATHSPGDSIEFRDITIPQDSLTYKFIATNSIVKDQTTGYGINEHGLAIISHDMDSWDDDSLGSEFFHDQDYVALALARCKDAAEAIDLFNDLILPYGINAETYFIADPNSLWLLETTGFNYVAKPIVHDVVSSQQQRFNIRTEWNDEGNRYNSDILTNAQAHGCDTTSLDFAECFGNRPPGSCDPGLLALKDRGNITVEDMRILVRDNADGGTISACVIPVRPERDPAFFSFMWDSRASPKYENVFLPYWIAMNDAALLEHYTSWPPDDSVCAWNIFSEIVEDSILRAIAEPIWQALQAELYAEFDTVEAKMQTYLDDNDTLGLRDYINSYVYGELDSAYHLAEDIISSAGVPEEVVDLTATLSEEDIVLAWSAVIVDTNGSPVQVDRYFIYRDTVVFFDPGAAPIDSTMELFYVDTSGVVGDTETQYYYAVSAVSAGKESEPSGLVGAFDIFLISW